MSKGGRVGGKKEGRKEKTLFIHGQNEMADHND